MEKVRLPNRPFGPFPTALVGAEVNGRPNYTTVGACGCVCLEPILYVSLKDDHCTTAGIRESGHFSINIPPAGMVVPTDYCGIVSGKTTDKSRVFTSFYDDAGRAPMIRECSLNFLCRVTQTLPICGFEMFFGEVVAAFANADCLNDGKLDPARVDPIIMMGASYWSVGQQIGAVYQEGKRYQS